MKKSFKQHHALLLISLFFFACEGTKTEDCATTEDGRGHVISVLPMGTISAKFMNDFLADNNIDIGVIPTFDVKVYSIVYETVDWDGEPRQASGAIYIPDEDYSNKKYPIYSGQHGTESKRTNVASIAPLRGFDALFVASVGYIGSSPDLLGLGISSDVVHPYVHAFVAEAVVDKIRATKNWLCSNGINDNEQLFIAGYSEGGYVAMATHKLIEEKYADEFTITASAPMAGPHDMIYVSNRITSRETYSQPGYISFTYMSYNTIEKLNRPATDLFQNPYAERLPKLMDGSKTIGEANDKLTTNMKSLFTENFIAEFLGDGEQELKNVFAKNSLVDWSPNAPIMLVHGENDITVGYNNSVIAHDKLKANGADITLITIPNGTHGSSVFPAYAAAMGWFSTLKK